METGERLLIEIAWGVILKRQMQEREALNRLQEEERERFYRRTKAHWDTAHEWWRKNRSVHGTPVLGPKG